MNMVAWTIIKLWATKWGKDSTKVFLVKHINSNAEMMTTDQIEECIILLRKLESFVEVKDEK